MSARPSGTEVRFESGPGNRRATCVGRFFTPAVDGAPIVVLAHGIGATVDSGLVKFAERLSAAGFGALAFDYRYFGASEGLPRQRVSMKEQVADYRAACRAALHLPGVDPQRLVVWGVSLAGGHVFEVAATVPGVRAAVALTPLVSGVAGARAALRDHHPANLARSTVAGLRSSAAQALGREPAMIPLVARPGEQAALAAPGYYEAYRAMAGPTWRNEIDARVGAELGGYRPAARYARAIRCPMLVQIADFDRSAPPHAAAKAAFAARAEVRHYPCGHFDVHGEWFDHAVRHQIAFLTRHLMDAAPTARQG